MAAPSGNRFWELRSKHGRDKLFTTPKLLWEAACEYFKWCEENPFKEHEAKVISNGSKGGSSIEIVELPHMRPFTLHGLCLYCGCSTSYLRAFKSTIQEKDKDYLTIITQIEETIYNQKFSGAASGFLKENIIARDLGLKDASQVEVKNEESGIFKVSGQEIKF